MLKITDRGLHLFPVVLTFQMAHELHGILTGAIASTAWDTSVAASGGGPESFLNKVVSPIYQVIYKVGFYPFSRSDPSLLS